MLNSNQSLTDPIEDVFEEISREITIESNRDVQPVQVIQEKLDAILKKIHQKLFIGNCFEDIYHQNNSFVVISNFVHSIQHTGFVTKFDKLEDISRNPKKFANFDYGSINSSCCLNSNFLLGFDSGDLVVVDDELYKITSKQYCHNLITKVLADPKGDRLVCSDFDGRIVLIDSNDFEAIQYYDYAHASSITDMIFNQDRNDLLISSGADNQIVLWDLRRSLSDLPATILVECNVQPTALDWPEKNIVSFGTETGQILQADLRKNRSVVSKHTLFSELDPKMTENDCSIHRIRPLIDQCGDLNYSIVFSANNHWIFDRKFTRLLQHQEYPKQIEPRDCLQLNENKDLLIVGTHSTRSYFENILENFDFH